MSQDCSSILFAVSLCAVKYLELSDNVFLDRVDVLQENTEAVFAACDSGHGRWAKLLGVRALLHPRLRFQEFLRIYNITQEFISATEKVLLLMLLEVVFMVFVFNRCCCCLYFYYRIICFFLFFIFPCKHYFSFVIMMPNYANVNRLVEGWDTALGGHYNHRPRALLISSMNPKWQKSGQCLTKKLGLKYTWLRNFRPSSVLCFVLSL
ncbi:unnamed protein product [Camellia sinensis]